MNEYLYFAYLSILKYNKTIDDLGVNIKNCGFTWDYTNWSKHDGWIKFKDYILGDQNRVSMGEGIRKRIENGQPML